MNRPIQHPVRWLYAFCDQPVFEQADVVELTGISKVVLQNWTNRQILRALNNNPGKQGRRQYSSVNVAALFLADRLVGAGMSPVAATVNAQQIITWMCASIMRSATDGGSVVLDDLQYQACSILHGRNDKLGTVFVSIDKRRSDIAEDLFNGGVCTVFDYGSILLNFLTEAQNKHFGAIDWSSPEGARVLGLVELGRNMGAIFERFSRFTIRNFYNASEQGLLDEAGGALKVQE